MQNAFRFTTGKLIDFYSGDWVPAVQSAFKFTLLAGLFSLFSAWGIVYVHFEYLDNLKPDYMISFITMSS